jgi:sulfur-oxidizing protein SoxA
MNKLMTCAAMVLSASLVPTLSLASPAEDLKAFQDYFKKRFPDTPYADFKNGVYSIDKASREEWEAIEEFPPYELDIEKGKAMFNTPFKNGKTYADCFKNKGEGIKQNYPYFDTAAGKVKTLEAEINECRVTNGEEPLPYAKGAIASLSAYMAYNSRGKIIDVQIPDDPKALAAYEDGKHHFYAKRGQLNLSCADCHVYNAGNKVRADILSPALGQVTHFPTYRSAWGDLGTIQRRYKGCNEQVRAKGFKNQGTEYNNLEFFHTYMSNGLEINGPGTRK